MLVRKAERQQWVAYKVPVAQPRPVGLRLVPMEALPQWEEFKVRTVVLLQEVPLSVQMAKWLPVEGLLAPAVTVAVAS